MKDITPRELQIRLSRGDNLMLLDVRQEWETRQCCLDKAINIPLDQLGSRAGELDGGQEIVVYCHHGMRSMAAAGMLFKLGFSRILNLTGGIAAWARDIEPGMKQY